MCEGSCFTCGWSHNNLISELLFVMHQCNWCSAHWVFLGKYSLEVRGFSGGLRKSNIVSLSSLFVFNALCFCFISCLSVGAMSVVRDFYVVWLKSVSMHP